MSLAHLLYGLGFAISLLIAFASLLLGVSFYDTSYPVFSLNYWIGIATLILGVIACGIWLVGVTGHCFDQFMELP